MVFSLIEHEFVPYPISFCNFPCLWGMLSPQGPADSRGYLQTLGGKHIKPSFPCDMGSAMTEMCTGGMHIRTPDFSLEEQGRLLGDEDP